jgi:hypothetical protein
MGSKSKASLFLLQTVFSILLHRLLLDFEKLVSSVGKKRQKKPPLKNNSGAHSLKH